MKITERIAKTLGCQERQVEAALRLLEEGQTIPFISRYRKEQTGNLDEDQLRTIEQSWTYQNNLQKRKESILSSLEEKKVLSPSLKQAVMESETIAQLEEVYRPYKEKRKTKASEALDAGFGPLAQKILRQKDDPSRIAKPEELEQAGYILAQQFADDLSLRQLVKEDLMKRESLTSARKKDAQDEQGVYENYYDFSQSLKTIPPHRILAMERGEKEKILTVSVTSDNDRLEELMGRRILKNSPARPYLTTVIHDALIRLMLPSIKREIRSELKTKAHEKAISGFASNLEHLLMTRPLKGQVMLSWDPGYAHGCKLAVLSESGDLLDTQVVYPFASGSDRASLDSPAAKKAMKQTKALIDRWKPKVIVIGNGTASRESVDLIASLLEDYPGISWVIGSEAGASVYSASELARQEFPDLPVELRSAISIGRRIQDPLSELVKIDPQSLGIGEYQHDVPQKQLQETLNFVTDKAVNRVGVNVNTASPVLLSHISGLKKPQINKLIKAREKEAIRSREQIRKLFSDQVYEQSIGFLRIPLSSNPLDQTGIHPESYDLTRRLLEMENLSLDQMRTAAFNERLKKVNVKKAAETLGSDIYTIGDILTELENPGLDPRDSLDGPVLKKSVLKMEDLTPGMRLEGTVRNVTSFGAFVDIGLHEDGLVHISKMADRFVKDPADIVHPGQIVTVYVLETNLRRKRISLSMVAPAQ